MARLYVHRVSFGFALLMIYRKKWIALARTPMKKIKETAHNKGPSKKEWKSTILLSSCFDANRDIRYIVPLLPLLVARVHYYEP